MLLRPLRTENTMRSKNFARARRVGRRHIMHQRNAARLSPSSREDWTASIRDRTRCSRGGCSIMAGPSSRNTLPTKRRSATDSSNAIGSLPVSPEVCSSWKHRNPRARSPPRVMQKKRTATSSWLPGPVWLPGFKGSHALIRQGAELVTTPDDILVAYGVEKHMAAAKDNVPLSPEEILVLNALKEIGGRAEVDKLSKMTRLEPRIVNRALSVLIIRGIVGETAAGYTI
jgi:hypothetical protein